MEKAKKQCEEYVNRAGEIIEIVRQVRKSPSNEYFICVAYIASDNYFQCILDRAG